MWRLLLVLACAPAPTPEAAPSAAAPSAGVPSAEAPAAAVEADPTRGFERRRQELARQVRALIADLEAAGRYDCCIQHPCNQCATRAAGCRCGEGLREGEPVCEECALMWAQGLGAEPGVDPRDVRSYLEASRKPGELRCGEPR